MRRGSTWLALITLACVPNTAPRLPTAADLLKTDWRPVTAFLDSAVAAGAAPGAVLGISVAGNRFVYAAGLVGDGDSARTSPQTIYDLGSVTKVVGLSTAVMLAVDDGRLQLDDPLQKSVPEFGGAGKERVTIRMLLVHASGLPAWRPLYRQATTRAEAYAVADSIPLDSAPGTVTVYSDLGAILLTQAIEAVYHERLDSLLARRVFQPLGMSSVRFVPPVSERERIAPTESDPWRGRLLRGEVHDENAAVMDGVSGHAGLFGNVPDLLTFAEWLLGWSDGRMVGWSNAESGVSVHPSIRPSVIREFTRRQDLVPGSSRALGWDTPSKGSSAGQLLSPRSFGHTGFTGTSLWIDPDHRLAIVLLSNRLNPTRDNPRWTPVRAQIADLVMTTLFEAAR